MITPVWDMDGTLLDTSEAVPQSFITTASRLGVDGITPAQVIAAYPLGIPERVLEHLLQREVESPDMDIFYRSLQEWDVQAYPGIFGALSALRDAGLPVAVVTGADSRGASIVLASAGLEVDFLVGGDVAIEPKPSPRGLVLIADMLRVPLCKIAYIGDSTDDLKAASAAGAMAVAASWGHLYSRSDLADMTLVRPADVLSIVRSDTEPFSLARGW